MKDGKAADIGKKKCVAFKTQKSFLMEMATI